MPRQSVRVAAGEVKVEYKSLIPPCASLKQLSPNFLWVNLILSCNIFLTIFLLFLLLFQLDLELSRAILRPVMSSARLRTESYGSPRCSWGMGGFRVHLEPGGLK